MKKVLVTGITGFAGSHLADHLVYKKKYIVSGTYLYDRGLDNLNGVRNDVELFKIDLMLPEECDSLIKKIKPDLIFHLAALPSPANSFKDPQKTLTNNIIAQVNILNAIKTNNLLNTKVLIISSADIYGIVKKENLPINESTPLLPLSPYAVSKIAQDFLALQYFLSYNLKIVRVRPFNHIGPRQSADFVVASIAKKIAEIEKGYKQVLSVGNLEARRDFTDVRDMVKAYEVALEKGKAGDVYNIGSGTSHAIRDILNEMISFSTKEVKIKIDKDLLRPIDNPDLVCDSRKFTKLTDWKPSIPIQTTLKDTLDYWRNIV